MSQTTTVPSVIDATFAEHVLDSALPVLVDFTADWCPPCRALAPVLDQLAVEQEQAGEFHIVSLNVDENPQTQAAYGVLATPTLMLFRAGEPVKTLVGARSKRRLLQELGDVLA